MKNKLIPKKQNGGVTLTKDQIDKQANNLYDLSMISWGASGEPLSNIKKNNPAYYNTIVKRIQSKSSGGYGYSIPEIVVKGVAPLQLDTFRPIVDDNYKVTGHSVLQIPQYDEQGNGSVALISKTGKTHGYNLITNNCSDDTRRILESTFGQKMGQFLFTTPGDVRDYALEHGAIDTNNPNHSILKIPVTLEQKKRAMNAYYSLVREQNIIRFKKSIQDNNQLSEAEKQQALDKYQKLVDKKQSGGALDFNSWYKTVPTDRNDTLNYNLRRAYELAPKQELEQWRTSSFQDLKNGKNHLRSVYENPNTGIYEFMKSKHHPTIQKELDWYNSNDKEAVNFRKSYSLDTSGDYYKYVPKKFYSGGLIKKKQSGGTLSKNILNQAKYLMYMPAALGVFSDDSRFTPHETLQDNLNKNSYGDDLKNYSYSYPKEIVITGTSPMHLITHKPFTDGFPIGHSSVEVSSYKDNGDENFYAESKVAGCNGYNLLTNNCSDGTRQVLEYTFNKKINPFLFTTPGDVRDFAIDSLHAKPSSTDPNTLIIPINVKQKQRAIQKISKLNNIENKQSGGILTYDNSQYKPSQDIVNQINKWEGSSMSTNNPISTEFNNFINLLPKDSVNKLAPNQLDALFSYNYNRPKAFKNKALPYIQELSTAQDQDTYNNIINQIANSFTVKSKLRGLVNRSNTERQIFTTKKAVQ